MVRLILRILLAYLGLCFLQRGIYLAWILIEGQSFPENLVITIAKGLLFDSAAAAYFLLPFALAVLILPARAQRNKWVHTVTVIIAAVPILSVLFVSMSEAFFFNEFRARFNFIAVDYLVYTHEVIRNAMESYPVLWILAAFAIVASPLIWWLSRAIRKAEFQPRERAVVASAFILALSGAWPLNEDAIIGSDAYWPRELAKNSMFALVSAYNRNSIDFREFYSSLDPAVAGHQAHEILEDEVEEEGSGEANEVEPSNEDEISIIRNIEAKGPQKKWNVIVVIIESMSARFMQHYGKEIPITLNLDRLADEGLFFNNLYATGTRTVRGLEALMLSLPPTPGQSILRRPRSEGIFNIGAVLSSKGYHIQFIYGGNSYFDNMKAWFSSNGFEVVDRSNFDSGEIQFENAWGVCDEDLFDQVLKQGDLQTQKGRPFFQAVLTTSNHRPYTYPDGRIDIPSKTGREGAVKYTDYAIGRFVEKAKAKPWFKNTLLVFVADHNAAVAGGTDIPIKDFLIPMIFYNPELVKSQKISKLASQIDFAPTLLGMMNFSYQSRFFGQNLIQAKAGRAVLGTYQKIALMTPGVMTVLAPGHVIETQNLDETGKVTHSESIKAVDVGKLSERIQKTVAFYQSASDLFFSGRDKTERQFPTNTNTRSF